jgi:hypothetical protein
MFRPNSPISTLKEEEVKQEEEEKEKGTASHPGFALLL